MVDVAIDVKERLKKIPGYQEGMPAHRMDGVSTFDELELTWGRKWGAQSGMGQLRYAWIHRWPDGPSDEQAADPAFFTGSTMHQVFRLWTTRRGTDSWMTLQLCWRAKVWRSSGIPPRWSTSTVPTFPGFR